MALSANTVWEVRTDGNDANGGGFVTGAAGTDYSQQAAAQKSGTDLAAHASTNTKVSPVAAKVAAADVGSIINISAGTNWTPGWYQITAQDGGDPGYWTLDRSPSAAGNANAATYKMGGALATPGGLGAVLTAHGVSGMKAYVLAGTYTLANANANTSGGPLSIANKNYLVEGYQTTRGDLGTAPVIDAGAQTGIDLVTLNGDSTGGTHLVNFTLDGNSGSTNDGLVATTAYGADRLYRVLARDCPGNGFSGLNGLGVQIKATGCGVGIATGNYFAHLVGAIADGNTTGFSLAIGSCLIRPVSINNTGDGFNCGTVHGVTIIDPTVYNNGNDGIDLGSRATVNVIGGVVTDSDAYGINNPSAWNFIMQVAGRTNTSGFVKTAVARDYGQITLAADPFVSAGTDFRPNAAATGGALLRGQGVGPWGQTNNDDIGAVQHSDYTLPNVKYVYNAIDRGDGTTGTLRASNLHSGAGAPGVNLAAADLADGVTVDDVIGELVAGGGSGGGPLVGPSALISA